MKHDDSHLKMQIDWNESLLAEFASLNLSTPITESVGDLKPIVNLDSVDENGNLVNSGDKARKAMRNIWFGG